MKSRRTKWVIALAVAVGGIWLMGVFYVLSYKPDAYINPGVVVLAPSPVAAPAQPVGARRTMTHPAMHHLSLVQPVAHTYSSHPMPTYQGLYATSGAQVHSVGGGGGHYANGTSSQGASSARGICYSSVNVAMPATNFIALTSQREIAQPAAAEAPQMARMAASPRTTPGPPPPNPIDLTDEHQLVEHPIGDAMWPLLLMALAYVCVLLKRSKV